MMTDSAAEQRKILEKKSAAVTLSDMEMFIFPDLIYSLVLANIMSPRIWKWREDPWFKGIETQRPYKRMTRIKQYIMDHYAFNLDLETWGLTTSAKELRRFDGIISPEQLSMSNALFGYEGDKYYFDIDIRTHFGLDRYTGDVIPYWKTETVEAMDAFCYKPEYPAGAGECVSLATLYAAALYVVGGIPLEDIYLMATPLHSQNYVDLDGGVLTNNRRLVTKNMWFNGTALSAQARRALENEKVTLVAHSSGIIHTLYDKATMDPESFDRFSSGLSSFLRTDLTKDILGNFLRHHGDFQKCFQFKWNLHGVDHFIPLERMFAYESSSPYKVTDNTRGKLVDEIEQEEFQHAQLPHRIVFNDLEDYISKQGIQIDDEDELIRLKKQFTCDCLNAELAIESLVRFCHTVPDLPDGSAKSFDRSDSPLGIVPGMSREAVIERVESLRDSNEFARMAFYSYRDLTRVEAEPYLLASIQRNPVAAQMTEGQDFGDVVDLVVNRFESHSVYDEKGRLAQPDEVWNFSRGDGLEKAVLLASISIARGEKGAVRISIKGRDVCLSLGGREYTLETAKAVPDQEWDIQKMEACSYMIK